MAKRRRLAIIVDFHFTRAGKHHNSESIDRFEKVITSVMEGAGRYNIVVDNIDTVRDDENMLRKYFDQLRKEWDDETDRLNATLGTPTNGD